MISGTFYAIGEVAVLLGVHRNTVARWLREGRLEGKRVGNLVLISEGQARRLKRQLRKGGET